MQRKKLIGFISIFIIVVSFILGARIRFTRLAEYTPFLGDAGTEFAVVSTMLKENIIPMIGPEIGEQNLNSPPTYFIFLTIAKLIFKTIPGTAYAFAIIGTIAAVLLTAIVFIENNKNLPITALAAMFFFSSPLLVRTSRLIWHPHPVIFFISASLFFLSLAKKTKKENYIKLSIVFYILGISTYISPILILPMMLFESLMFFKKKYPQEKIKAILKTAKTFLFPGLIIYASQIIYEFNNKFPILRNDPSYSRIGLQGIGESFTSTIAVLRKILLQTNPAQDPIPRQIFFILCLMFAFSLIYEGFFLKKIKKIIIPKNVFYIIASLIILLFVKSDIVVETYRLQPLFLISYLLFFSFIGFIVKRKLKMTFLFIALLIFAITANGAFFYKVNGGFDHVNDSYQGQERHVEIIKEALSKWSIENSSYFLLGNIDDSFSEFANDYSTLRHYHFHLMDENKLFKLKKAKNQLKAPEMEDLVHVPYLLLIFSSKYPMQNYLGEEINEENFNLIDTVPLSEKLNLAVFKNSESDYNFIETL